MNTRPAAAYVEHQCRTCREPRLIAISRYTAKNYICSPCNTVITKDQPHKKRLAIGRAAKLRDYYARIKNEILKAYGGDPPHCRCCGEATIAFLQIDHINENGAAHRRELFGPNYRRAGWRFYLWLRKAGFPSGFQVLCANCNTAKTHLGVCPHQENSNQR